MSARREKLDRVGEIALGLCVVAAQAANGVQQGLKGADVQTQVDEIRRGRVFERDPTTVQVEARRDGLEREKDILPRNPLPVLAFGKGGESRRALRELSHGQVAFDFLLEQTDRAWAVRRIERPQALRQLSDLDVGALHNGQHVARACDDPSAFRVVRQGTGEQTQVESRRGIGLDHAFDNGGRYDLVARADEHVFRTKGSVEQIERATDGVAGSARFPLIREEYVPALATHLGHHVLGPVADHHDVLKDARLLVRVQRVFND